MIATAAIKVGIHIVATAAFATSSHPCPQNTVCYTVGMNGESKTYRIGRYEGTQGAKTLARLIGSDGYFSAAPRGKYVILTRNL